MAGILLWSGLVIGSLAHAQEQTGKIIGINGDQLYIQMDEAAAVSPGQELKILWDLDGMMIDAGIARAESIDAGTLSASLLEGQPTIGMLIESVAMPVAGQDATDPPVDSEESTTSAQQLSPESAAESQTTEIVATPPPAEELATELTASIDAADSSNTTPQAAPDSINIASVSTTPEVDEPVQPEPEAAIAPPSPVPIQNNSNNLTAALAVCDQHLLNNRLTTGEGGNAFDCYRRILLIEPGNTLALGGMSRIESRYASMIFRELQDENMSQALTFIARLRTVNPDSLHIEFAEQEFARVLEKNNPVQSTPAPSVAAQSVTSQPVAPEPVAEPVEVPLEPTANTIAVARVEPDPVPQSQTSQGQIETASLGQSSSSEANNQPLLELEPVIPEVEALDWTEQTRLRKSKALSRFARAFAYEKLDTERGNQEALRLYRKAAMRGYARAQFRLGWMLENGIGIEADPALALAWYLKAEAQGNEKAALGVNRLTR